MEIIEFSSKYPRYNLGFLAKNPKTDTEKLSDLRMHLAFDTKNRREYQCFTLPEAYYKQILNKFLTRNYAPIVMTINNASFYIILKEGVIKGVCIETHERVMFDKPLKVVTDIPEDIKEAYYNTLGGN